MAMFRSIAQFFVVLLTTLGGCVHLGSDKPANFVVWRTNLASSAQPDRAYLARAKELGYDAVINLAPRESMGSIADEGSIVAAQGLAYVNIPVNFDRPALEDFERFSAAMQQLGQGRNVLVHCQVNLRASSFVFLYRVIHESAPSGDAAKLLTGVWVPNRVWSEFLNKTLERHGKSVEIL